MDNANSHVLSEFLRKERAFANLSQSDVAERSKTLNQKSVSRIEQDPIGNDLSDILEYLDAVGSAKKEEFFQLVTTEQLKPYKEDQMKLESQNAKKDIEELSNTVTSIETTLDQSSHPYLEKSNIHSVIETIKNEIKNLDRLPILATFGPSDAGKTTLLNSITGLDLLPTKWTPATCVITLLVHTGHKPTYIDGSVAVFKLGFQPFMLRDKELCTEYLIESGNETLLKQYGERNSEGEIYDDQAYMTVAFLDVPLLESVWLLDTPGQLIDPENMKKQLEEGGQALDLDVKKALSAVSLADGIVFLSSTTKFLQDGEPSFFASILRSNPPINPELPLENIIILKTHSYGEISESENKQTFNDASISLNKAFTRNLYDSWKMNTEGLKVPNEADWQGTMLPYFRENDVYRQNSLNRITTLIQHIQSNQDKIIQKRVDLLNATLQNSLNAELSILDSKLLDVDERVKKVKKEDARFRQDAIKLSKEFSEVIEGCKARAQSDKSQMRDAFNAILNESAMIDFIEERFENKKEAKEGVSDALSQHLENKSIAILHNSSKAFSSDVDRIVEKWQRAIPNSNLSTLDANSSVDLNIDCSSFDAKSAFVGGMTSVAAFGAMSVYVATIASNLGAYILVGKAAGILTALGITSGVTVLPLIVAQTGGPIVWGITIAALIGMLVFKLFSNWKKSMATSIIKALKSSDALEMLSESMESYWRDTKYALEKAIEGLEEETEKYLKQLAEDANTDFDEAQIQEAKSIIIGAKEIMALSEKAA